MSASKPPMIAASLRAAALVGRPELDGPAGLLLPGVLESGQESVPVRLARRGVGREEKRRGLRGRRGRRLGAPAASQEGYEEQDRPEPDPEPSCANHSCMPPSPRSVTGSSMRRPRMLQRRNEAGGKPERFLSGPVVIEFPSCSGRPHATHRHAAGCVQTTTTARSYGDAARPDGRVYRQEFDFTRALRARRRPPPGPLQRGALVRGEACRGGPR